VKSSISHRIRVALMLPLERPAANRERRGTHVMQVEDPVEIKKANRWLLPAAGVALVLTALAVACGGGDSNNSPTEPTTPRTVVIR
jgi:hypothetical protein